MCGSLLAAWNWRAMLSTPSASSPRPWTKMKAAAWEGLEGVARAGMMMGGLRTGGIASWGIVVFLNDELAVLDNTLSAAVVQCSSWSNGTDVIGW